MHPDKIMGKSVDNLDVPTDTQVLTFDSGKDQWDAEAGGGGGGSDFTVRIPLVMEIPQALIGFADIRALATQGSKISGMVLPNGGSTISTINFKCNVPNDLNSTPAASLKFIIIGLGTGTTDNVRLTVSSFAAGDGEVIDQAFTVETEATVPIPDAAETIEIYDQDMTTDPTAGDTLTVQLARDPGDASDDYGSDIMVIGAYLEIDITTT